MSNLTQFASIPNIGTHAALERLAEVYRESRQNPQQQAPYTTLFLKSGLSMRGHVIALSDDVGARSLLYLLHDPNRNEPTDLTYVLVEDVAAVTIHGAMTMVEHLSDGRITKPLGAPPSLGDLNRGLKAVVDEVNLMIDGTMTAEIAEIPSDTPPDAFHALHLLIRDLHAVLKKLASEELGRQHLKERAFKFTIKVGDEAKTLFNRSHCHLQIGVRGTAVERISRDSLRSNIEEFL